MLVPAHTDSPLKLDDLKVIHLDKSQCAGLLGRTGGAYGVGILLLMQINSVLLDPYVN